ncbi:Hsp33 family molecular chaperone HslO [Treponema sp.]|uniref:Hsp33 family molecular chaperone HslO n=1 Tax=Treponema sp. TaxID=166 RepID=UPI00298E70C0|nr:Hsp33 family molecular chaperone HslO [Treponema sp.]MCR5613405.1 Hsp33 family molecular chaperone HslO [Treponema sp.]
MIKKEITDTVLKDHLANIQKDGMSVFIMADGRFRGAFFNGTELINQMRVQHNLGILETLVLGQGLLCAALMIQTMKGKEHIVFRYETNGAARGFSVEVDSTGYVRGFILNDPIPVDKPLESWDLSPFFGEGTVTITRYTEGAKEGQTGVSEIIYKNIAKDLTHYFIQSEQINTAFNTSIQFDKEGRVIGAGGMFLQAIPVYGGKSASSDSNTGAKNGGKSESKKRDAIEDFANMAKDELYQRVENAFCAMPSIGQWFAEKGNRDDVVYGLFREFNPKVVLERDIIFDCPCCAKNFSQQIKHLPKAELDDIIKNDPDPIEVCCNNCGSIYKISKAELTL